MGKIKIPGLVRRKGGIWHIDKMYKGRRICRSCYTTRRDEAEAYLIKVLEELRQADLFGIRPERTFMEASIRYVDENQHKRSIHSDVSLLKQLQPWLGNLPLPQVHNGTLEPWVRYKQGLGRAAGTINHGLKIVRHILRLAESEWMYENGLTWLERAPRIKLLADRNKKPPYPLSWEEQRRLFSELPKHLESMALFAVNTGCRDREICRLQWDWEQPVRSLDTFVFVVPGQFVKNGDDRLVVLNDIARSVVNRQRGRHPTHVFCYKGRPMTRMLNSSWCRVRKLVGLPQVRVHDLKHTFGRRLRAAGVSFEDRQDLLGHRSGRMTTHYSSAELSKLIEAANTVCSELGNDPDLLIIR